MKQFILTLVVSLYYIILLTTSHIRAHSHKAFQYTTLFCEPDSRIRSDHCLYFARTHPRSTPYSFHHAQSTHFSIHSDASTPSSTSFTKSVPLLLLTLAPFLLSTTLHISSFLPFTFHFTSSFVTNFFMMCSSK